MAEYSSFSMSNSIGVFRHVERRFIKVVIKSKNISGESNNSMENFTVQLTNPMLYDRLHTLSAEYSVPVELLVNVAVKRLVDDVDFIRSLRTGKIDLE